MNRNSKIIATFLALGMVLTGFTLVVPAADQNPQPDTVANLVFNPIVTDCQDVAFVVAGVADIAVDAEVEVSTVPDFAIGTGTTYTTTSDNYATGAFRVLCSGLLDGTIYHYRVALTNGPDTVYYPSAATTDSVTTCVFSAFPSNPDTLVQVQDRPTNTNQADFLVTVEVEIGAGQNTYPLSLISSAVGLAAFTNNNLRNPTNGLYYQTVGGENYYIGAYGMWDDGGGMAYWSNTTAQGVYVGNPAPFAAEKTDKASSPGSSATATGPIGAGGPLIDVTYNWFNFTSGPTGPEPLGPSGPQPDTVANLVFNPIVTDCQDVAFVVAGVADIAVDAEVEVSTVPDFAIGTGTTYTTTSDNYATGAFRVLCSGLLDGTIYHYRVALTNGPDTVYYPSAATTDSVTTCVFSAFPSNPDTLVQVQDRPTNTNQADFLVTVEVEIGAGQNTYPLSLISSAVGLAAFTNNNLRNPTNGLYYQTVGGENYYIGAYGMWDDGGGMAYWSNTTAQGVYVGNPSPFAAEKTDGPPPVADAVELYYSNDWNATWNALGLDATVDGIFPVDLDLVAGQGTYWWIAASNRTDSDDTGLPPGGTPAEAGPYVYSTGMPPETLNLNAEPDPHDGNVINDFVWINATADDSMHASPDNINAAEFRVDGMGPWPMNAFDGAFDSPTEDVTSVFWFPPGFTEGNHVYEVHSSDVGDGWNTTVPWPSGQFAITDTTAPLGDYISPTPIDGANRGIGTLVEIRAFYEDFTA